MSDYIKREDAIKSLKESKGRYPTFSGEACAFIIAIQKIKNLPAADVVEVKHGQWQLDKEKSKGHVENIYICSSCGICEAWGETEKTSYCPNCGALMFED